MSRKLYLFVTAGLLLAILAGCSAAVAQPLAFDPAPWHDGEVSTYDVLAKDGSLAGTASWTWRRDAQGWVQAYDLAVSGRSDRGEVVVSAGEDAAVPALYPLSSWRELNGSRFETTYGADKVTITTTPAGGAATTNELAKPVDGLDNDATLQLQRALPLGPGYATRYTDVILTSGSTVAVKVSVTGAETITVPAGTFPAWHVVMDFGSGSHDGWYAQAAPHLLLKYRNRASGAVFVLRSWQAAAGAPVQGTPAEAGPPAGATAGQPGGQPPINVPFVLASVLVQIPLMLIFPILLGWWIRRHYGVGWGVFGAGALTFIGSQVLHLPFNWVIGLIGGGRGVALWPLPLVAIVAGLSAGVFEEGARWIVLTFFLKRARGWRAALQFGAGHGGVEAILLGLVVLLSLAGMLALRAFDPASLGLPAAVGDQLRAAAAAYWASPWYMPVLGGVERLSAVTMHLAFTVLVMRAVTRRRPAYLAAAIGAHAFVDAWSVWAAHMLGNIGVELTLLVLAALALALILRLREPAAQDMEIDG